ncbi:hypothetical protein ACOMHN_016748 [Nucella lapillus]
MSSQYNKRRCIMVEVFNVGDPVSIDVPKIDRSATDLPRIPGRVVKVNGSKQPTYTVETAFGLLKTALKAGDLQHYTGAVTVVDDTPISLQGLQDTVLQQNFSFDLPTSEYAQILHVGDNHWIAISSIDQASDTVAVYDSLRSKPSKTTTNLIARYNHSPAQKLSINVMNVQAQTNSHDCGVYALGFITALLHQQDPTTIAFVEPRSHLVQSLRSNSMAPFTTSTRTRTPKILHSITVDIFCSCRGIDTGTLMVHCDYCSEWYLADCLTIGKEDLEASNWLSYECNKRSKTNKQSKD